MISRHVSQGGLSYIRSGAGKPLIFIHGWAMASGVWERQVECFSGRGFEAVAADLRGHGDSTKEGPCSIHRYADDLKGFIHEMGYDAPILIGWSMGAMVILELIIKHPNSASAVCLVGCTPKFTEGDGFPRGLPLKDVKGMRAKLKRDFSRCLGEFRESIAGGLEEAEKRLITDAAVPSYEAAESGLNELTGFDLRDRLDKVGIPVLLIHGGNDRVCLPEASEYMAQRIKGARLVRIDDAGHVPFLSHRKIFNGEMEKFITEDLMGAEKY